MDGRLVQRSNAERHEAGRYARVVSNDRDALDCRHAEAPFLEGDRQNLWVLQKQLIGFSALSGM